MRSITVFKYIVGILITVCLVSCNKNSRGKEPGPTKDVEIEFDVSNVDEKLEMQTLQILVEDKSIRNIYLVATSNGGWSGCVARNITQMRERFFQPRMEMSKKLHGRGDFNFKLGEASKVPDDSLWYVKQGWTINKAYQKP